MRVQGLNLNNPLSPTPSDLPIALAAAKNEWADFCVEVSGVPVSILNKKNVTLRVNRLTGGGGAIDAPNFSAYQILSMPIDVNRAGFVRHTGLSVTRALLRALLPIAMNNGAVEIAKVRDPGDGLMFWIDLHIPAETPAGDYVASCDLIEGNIATPIATVPVTLKVYDFVLPDERHLSMVSRVEWDNLRQLYPHFESVEPRYMSRLDKRYNAAVATLDQLVTLAEANRTELIVPRLQPTVKWPDGRPPQIAWDDYDSVVSPWLKGDMFADKIPLGFWPMPQCEGLENYPLRDRLEYWGGVASHFGEQDWIRQSAVFLERSLQRAAIPGGRRAFHPGVAIAQHAITASRDASAGRGTDPACDGIRSDLRRSRQRRSVVCGRAEPGLQFAAARLGK